MRFAPGAENWPNRKADKAEILHGGFKYPHDKVRLAKDFLKLHLKKVNFLQLLNRNMAFFIILGKVIIYVYLIDERKLILRQ